MGAVVVRHLSVAVTAGLLALGLFACGSGGDSTSSEGTTVFHNAGTLPGVKNGKPGQTPVQTVGSEDLGAERARAGRAAGFVIPKSDNSVPTFGSEASAAERREAEANLRAYLEARAARGWAKACALLAASIRQGYQKLATSKSNTSCAKLLPVLAPFKDGEPANPLTGTLVAFRVQDANGFALFYGPPGHQRYMVPMNLEDGHWRPTQAEAMTYPPGA
jgi:hypothetical protein